ncbi:MAG: Hpt domain-containing protein [Oleispira sp.]|nr:Hpt domain-containing protein [Oleispira sp.]MBL4882162.1 Hpt domain-containing protein [Oleispira sp.]
MNTTIKDNDKVSAVWQPEKAITRLGGEKALMIKLAVLFIRDSPNLMKAVQAGINQRKYEDSYVALHSLQGTSANFYASKFEAECANLQRELKENSWGEAMIHFTRLTQHYKELDRELVIFTTEDNE